MQDSLKVTQLVSRSIRMGPRQFSEPSQICALLPWPLFQA